VRMMLSRARRKMILIVVMMGSAKEVLKIVS
jgi:hypothetical protein